MESYRIVRIQEVDEFMRLSLSRAGCLSNVIGLHI
jgi:hypothetical protein